MTDDFQNAENAQDPDSQHISSPQTPSVSPIWAISAKIVEESPSGYAGRKTRRGTRKFNANQKVYLWDYPNGNQWPMVDMVGRYRGKYKYIHTMINARYLFGFRAELIYSPTIIRYIQYGYSTPEKSPLTPEHIDKSWMPLDGSEASQRKALSIAASMNERTDQHRAELLKRIEEQRSKDL